MDESDEQWEQLQREAGAVDLYKYRRRFRWMKSIGLGAFLAGLTWLILVMLDSKRNPCERVRDYHCKKDPGGLQCTSYRDIVEESKHDSSAEMRSNILAQCEQKIERLKEEDHVDVK
jgi:hypothetical protein